MCLCGKNANFRHSSSTGRAVRLGGDGKMGKKST